MDEQHKTEYGTAQGGKGTYIYSKITLTKNTTIYVNVGGRGESSSIPKANGGGSNGGGKSLASIYEEFSSGGGGGATDIRIGDNSTGSRILVAAGGSGAVGLADGAPGGDNVGRYYKCTKACEACLCDYSLERSELTTQQKGGEDGQGGDGKQPQGSVNRNYASSGGGGGWYGGVGTTAQSDEVNAYYAVAHSGSSFVSGLLGCKSNKDVQFDEAHWVVGDHEGDGLIKISVVFQCPEHCISCSSKEECDACDNQTLIYKGQCYEDCSSISDGKSHFGRNEEEGRCEECEVEHCYNCSSNFKKCETCSSPFTLDEKLNKCLLPTNMFSKSDQFSQSSSFSKSFYFSSSFHFTKSEYFSYTSDFSKSFLFSKSSEFVPLNIFSISNKFSRSSFFSKSSPFSYSVKFIQSIQFSSSYLFSKSYFDDSSYFSNTLYLYHSSYIRKTRFYTKSSVFSPSNRSGIISLFHSTISDDFRKSSMFLKYSTSEQEYPSFPKSLYFSNSRIFSESSFFDQSKHLSSFCKFTKSLTIDFNIEYNFSHSHYFNKSSMFVSSNKYSECHNTTELNESTNLTTFSHSSDFTKSSVFFPSNEYSNIQIYKNSDTFTEQSFSITHSSKETNVKSKSNEFKNMNTNSKRDDIYINENKEKSFMKSFWWIFIIIGGVIITCIIIVILFLKHKKDDEEEEEEEEAKETSKDKKEVNKCSEPMNIKYYDTDDERDINFFI